MGVKKYIQIVVILGLFIGFVYLKNSKSSISDLKLSIGPPPTRTIPQKAQAHLPYKDGVYLGSAEDAHYGIIEVEAVIKNSEISGITFLQYPNDNNTSRYINETAMPILQQEVLKTQTAEVDIVTGASNSSKAFKKSLRIALDKATAR